MPEAMQRYRRSREVLEILVAGHPEDTDYSDNLAAVCNEIGMMLGQHGQTAACGRRIPASAATARAARPDPSGGH